MVFVRGKYIRRALDNSAWLLGERGVTLALNLLVSILLARHLGASAFGSLSYAIAFVALLGVIPYLGLTGIVVQHLVEDEDAAPEILGTAVYLRLTAALLALLGGNLIAQFIVDDPRDRILIFLISLGLLFEPVSSLRLLFDARVESKWMAIVGSASSLVSAIARVLALLLDAPLWVFAGLVTVQAALTAFGLLTVYQRHREGVSRLRFNMARATILVSKSWPLILSYAGATVYLKIDQLMLGQMVGMTEVAQYAVASRLSEVWYLVPVILAGSIFPRLLVLRRSEPEAYLQRLTEAVRYLFWTGVLIAVPVTFLAMPIVTALYGEDYSSAGIILTIHIWACPAVFMGMMVEKWFLAEDLLKYLIGRQIIGASLNIFLNLLLIPTWGGQGAAVATIISYTVAYYLSCFTSRRTYSAGKWMTEAIFWPVTWVLRRVRTA